MAVLIDWSIYLHIYIYLTISYRCCSFDAIMHGWNGIRWRKTQAFTLSLQCWYVVIFIHYIYLVCYICLHSHCLLSLSGCIIYCTTIIFITSQHYITSIHTYIVYMYIHRCSSTLFHSSFFRDINWNIWIFARNSIRHHHFDNIDTCVSRNQMYMHIYGIWSRSWYR